jgi:hypothetical protein
MPGSAAKSAIWNTTELPGLRPATMKVAVLPGA